MAKTNREKLDALKQQLIDLDNELGTLKKERAEARINGGTFTSADRITAIATEIEEINEAIPVVQRLVDADDARAMALNRAQALEAEMAAFEDASADYLGHVATLENAAADLKRAFAAIHSMLPAMSTHILRMTGQTHDPLFLRPNCDARLFTRMAAVLDADFEPLRPYSSPASDALSWPTSWVDHESRNIDAMVRGFVSKLKAQIAELRSSAGE